MNFLIICSLLFTITSCQSCRKLSKSECIASDALKCVYLTNKDICEDISRLKGVQEFGCSKYLSKFACRSQEPPNECILLKECAPLSSKQKRSILCQQRPLSKAACLSLTAEACYWDHGDLDCKKLQIDPKVGPCETTYEGLEISPKACENTSEKCFYDSSRYNCAEAGPSQTSNLKCTDIGLSSKTCTAITTENQFCILQNSCKTADLESIDQCKLDMNIHTCLLIQKAPCRWQNEECTLIPKDHDITFLRMVNPTACAVNTKIPLQYDQGTKSCINFDKNQANQCNYPGLNKLSCFQLDVPCFFHLDKCERFERLDIFPCSSKFQLNKQACLANIRSGEACKWNKEAESCESILIGPSDDCESQTDVNKNVCSLISKEPCKYSPQDKKCVKPSSKEQCLAPSLNRLGCIQVNETSCMWREQQCIQIQLQKGDFRCQNLKNANPKTCASFDPLESDKEKLCRFDETMMGCVPVLASELDSLKCNASGLNNYACASIKTLGQACQFKHGECQNVEQDFINNPCELLVYANPLICARQNFMTKESCQYDSLKYQCTKTLSPNANCDSIGLNIYGCSAISNLQLRCFYKDSKCQRVEEDIQQCTEGANREACLQIKNDYCEFYGICKRIELNPTNTCSALTSVSCNVCASIDHKNPLDDPGKSGFCRWENGDCKPITEKFFSCPIEDPCCTKTLCINTHACSRYTNRSNKYCYFENNICKEYQAQNNKQELKEIREVFNSEKKLPCQAANYKLCGLLDQSDMMGFQFCVMPGPESVCLRKRQNEIEALNIDIITEANTRASPKVCALAKKSKHYISHDGLVGRCIYLDKELILDCDGQLLNYNACMMLTRESRCLWNPTQLVCERIDQQVLALRESCEALNQLACIEKKECLFDLVNEQCTHTKSDLINRTECDFGENYLVSPLICISFSKPGELCLFDTSIRRCSSVKNSFEKCSGYFLNEFQCYANTEGFCQWDQNTKECVELLIPIDQVNCVDRINKKTCLMVKTKGQTCVWKESSLKCELIAIDSNTTCEGLAKTIDKYNPNTCISIFAQGSYCTYDHQKQTCEYQLCESPNTDSKYCITKFEKCNQRVSNIHMCLGRTKGSFCQFDDANKICNNYNRKEEKIECTTFQNISREVCMEETNIPCKFNLITSKCEKIEVEQKSVCSQFYANSSQLFNKNTCIRISPDVPVSPKVKAQFCDSIKPICHFEQYCYFSQSEDGCNIYHKMEEEKFNYQDERTKEQIESCRVQWPPLTECLDIYSQALCLQIIKSDCYFHLPTGGCQSQSKLNSSVELPEDCTMLGHQICAAQDSRKCFLDRKSFLPQCNIPADYYLVCLNWNSSSPKFTTNLTDVTIRKWKYETQEIPESPKPLQVSPLVCSAFQQGACIFDESFTSCQIVSILQRPCSLPGLSKQACLSPCVYINERCNTSQTQGDQVLQPVKFNIGETDDQIINSSSYNQAKSVCLQSRDTRRAWPQKNLFLQAIKIQQEGVWNCGLEKSVSQCGQEYTCQHCVDFQSCKSCFASKEQSYRNNLESYKTQNMQKCYIFEFKTLYVQNTVQNGVFQQQCSYSFDNCSISAQNDEDLCKQKIADYCVQQCQENKIPLFCQFIINEGDNICSKENLHELTYINSCQQKLCCSCAQQNLDVSKDDLMKECRSQQNCRLSYDLCFQLSLQRPCSEMQNYLSSNKKLCISSTQLSCKYNINDQGCEQVTSPINDCSSTLNKIACVQHSEGLCIWLSDEIGCKSISIPEIEKVTVCSSVSAKACPFMKKAICSVVGNSCIPGTTATQCKDAMNMQSCTNVEGEACIFTKAGCQAITSQQAPFNCRKRGINKAACLLYAQGLCKFDEHLKSCIEIEALDEEECGSLSKASCLQHLQKMCMWNSNSNACTSVVFRSNIADCNNPVTEDDSKNMFNQLTCSSISTPTRIKCYSKDNKCVALSQNTEIPCWTLGINRHGCLEGTTEKCSYYDGRCYSIESSHIGCDASLNWKACVTQKKKCIWQNGICSNFLAPQTYDGLELKAVLAEDALCTPSVCQAIAIPRVALQHNAQQNRCLQVTQPTLLCHSASINQAACLEMTSQFCQWQDGYCKAVFGGKVSEPETLCLPSYNQKFCLAIGLRVCSFKNGHCEDTQADLSCETYLQSSPSLCSKSTGKACQFDTSTNKCMFVINANLSCQTPGLNKEACLTNTVGYQCRFMNAQCMDYIVNQDTICVDIISIEACAKVFREGQYCFFENNKCNQVTPQMMKEETFTKCESGLIVNSLICGLALDAGCRYDWVSKKCVKTSGLEACDADRTFNQKACTSNLNKQMCIWRDEEKSCQKLRIDQLQGLKCQDPINRSACLGVQGEICQYVDNACKLLNPEILQEKDCNELTDINSERACESIIKDEIGCAFNSQSQRCERVSLPTVSCSRGQNKIACDSNPTCSWEGFCKAKDSIITCQEAKTQGQCISAKESCQWVGGICAVFSAQVKCQEVPALVSPRACLDQKTTKDFCLYSRDQSKCYEGLPKECGDLIQQSDCINQKNLPCIWSNEMCTFTEPKADIDGCQTYQKVSKAFCTKIRKEGELCEYIKSQCQQATLLQKNWPDNNWPDHINYNTCLAQRLQACQWKGDKCICLSSDDMASFLGKSACALNFSFKTCLSIGTKGYFCAWRAGVCQSLRLEDLKETDIVAVNVNVCVQLKAEPYYYDAETQSCRKATNNLGCGYPGLNQKACIMQQFEPCLWKNSCELMNIQKGRLLQSQNQASDLDFQSMSRLVCKMQNIATQFKEVCEKVTSGKNLKCEDEGLNFKACMLVQDMMCEWRDDTCLQIDDDTKSCTEYQNVNSFTCSQVIIEPCGYDEHSSGCQPFKSGDSCALLGLNQSACISIPNCIFKDSKCQLHQRNEKCPIEALAVNRSACLIASDSCAYEQSSMVCQKGRDSLRCDENLNRVACSENKNCLYQDSSCICVNTTNCTKQQIVDKTCQVETCESINFDGDADNYLCQRKFKNCYQSSAQKCRSAISCNDVKIDSSLQHLSCQDIIINNQFCMEETDPESANSCQPLNCHMLSYDQEMCNKNSKCKWDDKKCREKICSDFKEASECNGTKLCTFLKSSNSCETITTCKDVDNWYLKEHIKDQEEYLAICKNSYQCAPGMSLKRFDPQCVQCFPERRNSTISCVPTSCESLGSLESKCIGRRYGNQVCVLSQSKVCQVCEMHKTHCDCNQSRTHCSWNHRNSYCTSKLCEEISEREECSQRSDCNWLATCKTKCSYYINEDACTSQQTGCLWNEQLKKCSQCLVETSAKVCGEYGNDKDKCSKDQCCKWNEPNICMQNCSLYTSEQECNFVGGKKQPKCQWIMSPANPLLPICRDKLASVSITNPPGINQAPLLLFLGLMILNLI